MSATPARRRREARDLVIAAAVRASVPASVIAEALGLSAARVRAIADDLGRRAGANPCDPRIPRGLAGQ